jgi:hypothetical protein
MPSAPSTANAQPEVQICRRSNWTSSGANAFRKIAFRSPVIVDLCFIFASFALAIGVVSLLGSVGLPFGFDVFPFGEDDNWVDMLRRGGISGAAQLAWQQDHRNPLSAWWYIAARGLILNFEQGLLWLRYIMAAALALCTYAMAATVGRSRSFALGLAMLTIFWMANRFTEQIIWNFQAALCASLISVAAYAQFVNGGRRSYFLYGFSLVFWFIAFATYTIQCGAVLAIGYLALRTNRIERSGVGPRLLAKLRYAISDTFPYVALFGIFLLIWLTTTSGGFVDAIWPHFHSTALLASLRQGIWSEDLKVFFLWVWGSPDRWLMLLAACACGVLAFFALRVRSRLAAPASSVISIPRLVDVIIVLGCIAAPTVMLESASSIWPPGTRWPMIYQLTTPGLLLACVAVIALVFTRAHLARQSFWAAMVALAIGVGELFSLGYNQRQVEITRNEKSIRDGLLRLVAEDLALGRRPQQVLLMLDASARWTPTGLIKWRSLDVLSPTIARVWLQRDDISFRLVPWGPPYSSNWKPWWAIRFGSDSEGVGNAKVLGGTLPYSAVRVLEVRNGEARRVAVLDRSDVTGWEVEWDRDQPIRFSAVDSTKLCPLAWAADHDALTSGWSIAQVDRLGPVRWTVSRSAHLIVPAACEGAAALRATIAYAVSERNLEELAIRANGQQLRYRRHREDNNEIYEAEIPAGVLSRRPILDLELAVKTLDTVRGEGRNLGVAVRRIEVSPAISQAPRQN